MTDEPRVRVLGPDPAPQDEHGGPPPPTRLALALLALGVAAAVTIAAVAWPRPAESPETRAATVTTLDTTATDRDDRTPFAPAPPAPVTPLPGTWDRRTVEWFNAGSMELAWHDLGDPEWVSNPVVWDGGFAAVAGIGVNAVLATSAGGEPWGLEALPAAIGEGHGFIPQLFAGDDALWLLADRLYRMGSEGGFGNVVLPGEIREYAPGSEVLVIPQGVLALPDGTVVVDGTFSMGVDWLAIVDALDLAPWRGNPPLWDPRGSLLYLGDVEAGIPVEFTATDTGIAITVTDPASQDTGTFDVRVPVEVVDLALAFLRETGGVQGSNLHRVTWRVDDAGVASGPYLAAPFGTPPVLAPDGRLLSVESGRVSRVWRSPDAIMWEASEPVFFPGEQLVVADVVASEDTMLAIGSARRIVRIAPEVTAAEQAPVVWQSHDGQTWQGVPAFNVFGVTHHPTLGWIGTTWTGDSGPEFALVHSARGLEWSTAPVSSLVGLNIAGIAATDDAIALTLFVRGGDDNRAFAWSGPVSP